MDRIHSRWRSALGLAFGVSLLSIVPAAGRRTHRLVLGPQFQRRRHEARPATRYNATHPDVTHQHRSTSPRPTSEQKLQTQLLAGTTEGLPDIVLIEDYRRTEVPAVVPGRLRAAQRQDRYDAVRALQGRGRHGRRQVLLAALRLRRHRPLLPLRLPRRRPASRARTCRTSPGTSSSRSARPSRKRPATAARHRHQRRRLDPHHAAVGRQVVLQRRWQR